MCTAARFTTSGHAKAIRCKISVFKSNDYCQLGTKQIRFTVVKVLHFDSFSFNREIFAISSHGTQQHKPRFDVHVAFVGAERFNMGPLAEPSETPRRRRVK